MAAIIDQENIAIIGSPSKILIEAIDPVTGLFPAGLAFNQVSVEYIPLGGAVIAAASPLIGEWETLSLTGDDLYRLTILEVAKTTVGPMLVSVYRVSDSALIYRGTVNVQQKTISDRVEDVPTDTEMGLLFTASDLATTNAITASQGVITGAVSTSEGVITGAISASQTVINNSINSVPTAQENADEVLDEPLADHLNAHTVGKAISDGSTSAGHGIVYTTSDLVVPEKEPPL